MLILYMQVQLKVLPMHYCPTALAIVASLLGKHWLKGCAQDCHNINICPHLTSLPGYHGIAALRLLGAAAVRP